MMGLLRLLRLRLGGTLGMVPGAAFATGDVTAAQLANIPCELAREGEERRIPGSSGVASRKVRCEFDGSAWAWVEVGAAAMLELPFEAVSVTDGVAEPAPVVGRAIIFVDTADGDLKVIFGDGVVKTLAADT